MSGALGRADAAALAGRLRELAQPQRLMIMALLLEGERTVAEIEAAASIGQPALSQQLAALRRAGLVATRRDARLVLYRMADEAAAERVRAVLAAFGATRAPARRPPVPRARPQLPPVGAAWFARIA